MKPYRSDSVSCRVVWPVAANEVMLPTWKASVASGSLRPGLSWPPSLIVSRSVSSANFAAPTECTVGQELKVDLFADVKSVDVTGISKGRGTAGVMKRHGFSGQRATHGVKKVHRHAGSTGCNTFPARVFKGRRMAGRYGAEQNTVRNLKVVGVDSENNLLLVRGAIPGPNGGFVVVKQTNML